MNKKNRVIGILGGMGPFATAEFFQKIILKTPAKKDWEHLRLVIDNNPHIPSRTRHLLYGETSPIDGMIESCKKLELWPVDLIAIPCNSACYFIDKIQPFINTPIANIISVTAKAIEKNSPQGAICAVLGGYVTYKTESYKDELFKCGFKLFRHPAEMQAKIESSIEDIKLNRNFQEVTENILNIFQAMTVDYGVEVFILGCTEFGLIYQALAASDFNVVDSSTALAEYLIKFGREDGA